MCQFARDLVNIPQGIVEDGVENVGKRTPSDPMETGCRGKSPSLVNIPQGIVEEGVENVGKRTPSDPMETNCCDKSPSDCRVSVCETLMETGCRGKS